MADGMADSTIPLLDRQNTNIMI